MPLAQNGYMTLEELKATTVYPSEERMSEGPVAVIECIQEIPCNPCEAACKKDAIHLGEPITNLPKIDLDKCGGCGLCVAQCPGLAIFVVDKSYSETTGTVIFPYEYYPMPEEGQKVTGVDRSGKDVCRATVRKVMNPKAFDRTPVVTVEVPKDKVDHVRSIKRTAVSDDERGTPQREDAAAETAGLDVAKPRGLLDLDVAKPKGLQDLDVTKTAGLGSEKPEKLLDFNDDDMLVCRCEEVTLGEIREAIRQGAKDVTGVKRRTRAGMGLCQGRTCEKLVQQILKQELGSVPEEIGSGTARPPVRPITFGSLSGGDNRE